MKISNNDFDLLVSKSLDSSLSVTENKILSTALKDEPNLQRRYCKYVLLESLLHWESESIPEENPKFIKFPIWAVAGSVAAVLVCLLTAWFLHQSDSIENIQQAQITYNTPLTNRATFSSEITEDSFVNGEKVSHTSLLNESLGLIEKLSDGDSFTDGTSFTLPNGLSLVSRDDQLSTSSIDGVLPLVDNQMIQFRGMKIDTTSQRAEAVETLRVYDLKNSPPSFENIVDASVCFNQSYTDLSDSTEFSISILAVNNPIANSFVEIASSSQVLTSDNDHSTWERVDTTFILPEGTDYLVVSLTAKKSGPSALNSNLQSFFADELELSFAGI
jgi:hypothetical protein